MTSKLTFFFSINFLFLFLVSSQHQFLAPTSYYNSSSFNFIESLHGCRKGDTVQGINMLKKYLNRFGYLTYSHSNQPINQKPDADNIGEDNYFDEVTEAAIKAYQLNHDLKPTGMLDNETVSVMSMPRCGVPDHISNETRMNLSSKTYCHGSICIQLGSYYTVYGEPYKWPPEMFDLTYAVAPSAQFAEDQIAQALNRWASVSHFTFSNTLEFDDADIRISFETLDHHDGEPFDGPGGIIAHAFAPTNGRIHFDGDDPFSVGPVDDASDIKTVALHEIGHALGLRHSTIREAIMWPSIPYGTVKDLHDDDIQGIKALYP